MSIEVTADVLTLKTRFSDGLRNPATNTEEPIQMNNLLKEVAEEVGASNSEAFISYLSLRAQGSTRKKVAQQVSVSPKTLYNWNKAIMEISREKRLKVLILAIIQDEDLDLKVIE